MNRLFFVIPGLLLLLASVPGLTGTPEGKVRISSPDEIKAEFDSVPCKNKERLNAVKALFERMGASPSDIQVEKSGGAENVVIRKPGASDEKVIVSAHYDKVAAGCGAIDDWSGVVAVAHLYRTLKDVPLKKTVLFVAFDKEEDGLVGAEAVAKAIRKEDVAQYCAMIDIDSLGLTVPQVLDNMSSKKLAELAAGLAKKIEVPFSHAEVLAAADTRPFLAKKIPAVSIHGLNNEWKTILHSDKDQARKVNPQSVYLGYRLTLAMLAQITESPCQAYSEQTKEKADQSK